MHYRLLAIDLDGTLLGPDLTVSRANADAIADAQATGALVVPCTGRGWRESTRALSNVTGLTVGVFNTGAAVVDMDTGTALDLAAFEPHVVLGLVQHLRTLPEAVLVYQDRGRTGRDYLVTGDGELNDNTRRWFTMNGLAVGEIRHPTPDDLRHSLRVGLVAKGNRAFAVERDIIDTFGDVVDVHAFAGVPTAAAEERVYITEVFAKGVTKWRGLRYLMEQQGIPASEVAVIGDEVNDLAMLEHAGLAVAMANAVDRAKALAHRHTLSNLDDGVAHAIRHMLTGSW